MEELRSTDILDKEIESDARKKAERILTAADAECQKKIDAVDGRVKEVTDQKTAYYSAKMAQLSRDSDAALPLEKERFLVSFTAHHVAEAINAYLTGLTSDQRLELIVQMLEDTKKIIEGKKVAAQVFGFDLNSAKKILDKAIGKNLISCVQIPFEKSGEESALFNTVHEGIILETEDKFIRCRLTLDQLIGDLENKYSYELASTLFGGRLPE